MIHPKFEGSNDVNKPQRRRLIAMTNSLLSKEAVNKLVLEQCLNLETALMYVELEDDIATVWLPETVQSDPELATRFTSPAGNLEPPTTLCVLVEEQNPNVLRLQSASTVFPTSNVSNGSELNSTWVPAPNVMTEESLISQLEQDYAIEVNLEPEGFAASRAGLPIFHSKNRGELVALLALTAENTEVQGSLTTQDWVGKMLESFSQTA